MVFTQSITHRGDRTVVKCDVYDCFFTARRIASAVLAIAISSVCPSVRPSHAGIVSKRRHIARCSLHFG